MLHMIFESDGDKGRNLRSCRRDMSFSPFLWTATYADLGPMVRQFLFLETSSRKPCRGSVPLASVQWKWKQNRT